MARRARSYARDFEDLHGQAWPPHEASRPEGPRPEKPRVVHVIDENGVVLETRQEPHRQDRLPRVRLNLPARIFAVIAILYSMGVAAAAFGVVGVLAFVFLSALFGAP